MSAHLLDHTYISKKNQDPQTADELIAFLDEVCHGSIQLIEKNYFVDNREAYDKYKAYMDLLHYLRNKKEQREEDK